jgi:trk system potassium uptake protein TrkA
MLGPRHVAVRRAHAGCGTLDAVHIVIMGCGRVGSTLAEALDTAGHSVSVIDADPQAFRRLSSDFGGRTVTGIGFDREVLQQAGTDRASAFAAVSSGDNSNIIAARVARETFGVENVAARIYDQRRAAVYERLGIPTVATVRWTADQIMRRLLPQGAQPEWLDSSGQIRLAQVHLDPSWIGLPLRAIERSTTARIAFVNRLGEGMLPPEDGVLQQGDVVHVLVRDDQLQAAQAILDGPPPTEES